jgi:uncharacterized protein YccT (UPF0319 family)
VTLPIVNQKQSTALETGTLRIVFKVDRALPVETFQIKTQCDTFIFTGDGRTEATVQWAVDHYLDKHLGTA